MISLLNMNGSAGLGNMVNTNPENVMMKTSDPRHYGNRPVKELDDDVTGSFDTALKNAVQKVNNLQVDADSMTTKMIYEPESVDIHNVMVAQQKAEVSLNLAKAVRDEAIRAYRELINLR